VIAGKVAVVRDQVARALTLSLLGRREDSLALAREATAVARGLSYQPVYAEALAQTASALDARGTTAAHAEAEQLFFEALDIAEAERHDELAVKIWNDLVLLAVRAGRDQAHAWSRRNEAAVHRVGDDAYELAKLHYLRGEIFFRESKFATAAGEHKLAIAAIERAPAHRLELSRYYNGLANALERMTDLDESRRLHERSLAIAAEAFGPGHPELIKLQTSYGRALIRYGQFDRARSVLETALNGMSPRDRDAHPIAAKLHSLLSDVDYMDVRRARFDRAAEHGRAALEIYRRTKATDRETAEALMNLGNADSRRRNFKDALVQYESALALQRRGLNPGNYQTGINETYVAETLAALGRHDEAMVHMVEATRIFDGISGFGGEDRAWLLTVHGQILVGQQQLGAAVPVLERALELFGDKPAEPSLKARAMWTLARALYGLGRDGDRVRTLAERARTIFTAQGAVDAPDREATARFIEALPAREPPTK
jgi:tetratricopeptide (TPR) repeat protein